jgi:hypothetical protein
VKRLASWTGIAPVLALAVLAATWGRDLGYVVVAIVAVPAVHLILLAAFVFLTINP